MYPLESTLKAIEHAQSIVKGGKGPGGTVGISYATRALGITDKTTLAAWLQNRSFFQKQGQQAAATVPGTKSAKAMNTLSVGVGRLPSHVEVERLVVAWINDLRSDWRGGWQATCC